ncbi:MAG: methyl-accepting chemotaxis protein [Pseudomonadota bacterium]
MRPSFFKRTFFIKKDLQGKYIFKFFLLFGIGSIMFTLIFSFSSSNTLSIVYDNYQLHLGTTPSILMNKILSTQWLLIVVGGAIMMVLTLLLTHRIAGPFFRFEKTLEEMLKKNLAYDIFLRKKDEGKEIGLKINAFNKMMRSDLTTLQENSARIHQLLDDSAKAAQNGENPHPSTVQSIIELNQKSIALLSQYQLHKD